MILLSPNKDLKNTSWGTNFMVKCTTYKFATITNLFKIMFRKISIYFRTFFLPMTLKNHLEKHCLKKNYYQDTIITVNSQFKNCIVSNHWKLFLAALSPISFKNSCKRVLLKWSCGPIACSFTKTLTPSQLFLKDFAYFLELLSLTRTFEWLLLLYTKLTT